MVHQNNHTKENYTEFEYLRINKLTAIRESKVGAFLLNSFEEMCYLYTY